VGRHSRGRNCAAVRLRGLGRASRWRSPQAVLCGRLSRGDLLPRCVRDGIISHTAAPMIGGMITAPLLSMLVLPAVYRILNGRELGQSKPG